jgi:hypothetical protein
VPIASLTGPTDQSLTLPDGGRTWFLRAVQP